MKIKVGEMKEDAATFLKHLWTAMSTMLRKTSEVVKDKADAMKILGFTKDDKVVGAISNKANLIWRYRLSAKFKSNGSDKKEIENNKNSSSSSEGFYLASPQCPCPSDHYGELLSPTNRLIASDSPRNSSPSPEIRSENEIDRSAGSFIRRFRNQLRMQKQNSFNSDT